jgi:PII-like signaling protein
MLCNGPAKKVTIFINEDARHHMSSLHDAILVYLMHKGVAGATVTRALAGFGSHHSLHTPDVELLAQHLPLRIEFIDSAAKVEEVLPTLYEMVADGLIEVQDTTVIKTSPASGEAPARAPRVRYESKGQLLRVFLGESDQWHGEPLHEAIVKKLRMLEVAGATVYRGILGYGAKGHQHKRSFFHPMRDLPVMISVIDTAERIAAATDAIEDMIADGLIVTSDVDLVRIERSTPAGEVPHAASAAR